MSPFLVVARRGWSSVLGAVLWCAAGAWSPAASAQSVANWQPCASEGRACRISGEALVRYGADGRFAYRLASGRVRCDNEVFGDAAPGQRKHCDVSYNWRDDPVLRHQVLGAVPGQPMGGMPGPIGEGAWQPCAPEGGACRFPGQAVVRFGVPGQWELRTVVNQVDCDRRVFGDPAPGVVKRCEVQLPPSAAPGRVPPSPHAGGGGEAWVPCAREDEVCQVPGSTTSRVRFGGNGVWFERQVQGPVRCEVAEFGDPSPDVRKRCEVLRVGAALPPGGVAPGGAPAGAAGDWIYCASEGGRCQLRGVSMVRFGVPGHYRYLEAGPTVACDIARFGGDPAPNQRKQCDVLKPAR